MDPNQSVNIADEIRTQFFEKGIACASKHRVYCLFELTSWLHTIENGSQRSRISWLDRKLYHSVFWLGTVAFAEAIPLLVFIALASEIEKGPQVFKEVHPK